MKLIELDISNINEIPFGEDWEKTLMALKKILNPADLF